jgi:hypothetical protein
MPFKKPTLKIEEETRFKPNNEKSPFGQQQNGRTYLAFKFHRKMEKTLQAAEMKFVRKTASLTLWDHKRNEEILKNLKVEPVFKFIQNYRANWKEHFERMDSSRIPNNLLNYRPHGKRSLGRPLKRWSEAVTGHLA